MTVGAARKVSLRSSDDWRENDKLANGSNETS